MSVMVRAAVALGGLLTALLAAGCAIHAAGAPRGPAQSCAAAAEHSLVQRGMPAGCQGRSGTGVARLTAVSRPASGARRRTPELQKPSAAAPAQNRGLAIATLITWLLTASIGGYMLHTWIVRGGLNRQRASGDGFPRVVIFGHVTLASTGLAVWACYLLTNWAALAWTAVGLLTLVAGLGISTVTLFTPYPARAALAGAGPAAGPADPAQAAGVTEDVPVQVAAEKISDEVLARALTDDVLASKLVDDMLATLLDEPPGSARKPQWHVTALIPAFHGALAITTILLAVVTAASTR
jgi:hypothetical protein